MTNTKPIATAKILIRKPAEVVFNSFIEPAQLTKFWLAKADAPLKVGQAVRWEFMVPGAVAQTTATEMTKNQLLAWKWDDGSTVKLQFRRMGESETVVSVENAGFGGTPDEAFATALEATQGFTIVLCDLKTLLESGKSAGLVKDKAWLIEQKQANQ